MFKWYFSLSCYTDQWMPVYHSKQETMDRCMLTYLFIQLVDPLLAVSLHLTLFLWWQSTHYLKMNPSIFLVLIRNWKRLVRILDVHCFLSVPFSTLLYSMQYDSTQLHSTLEYRWHGVAVRRVEFSRKEQLRVKWIWLNSAQVSRDKSWSTLKLKRWIEWSV